jgi:4-carboxymuconolactone decarboxylase
MVDLPSQPLAELDLAFEAIALETGELTYGLPGLRVREKLLVCLANDVCRGHLGLAFQLHVGAALSHGVPFSTLLAAVRFIAPYAGYPAAADAIARLTAVGATLDVDTRAAAAEDAGDGARSASGTPDRLADGIATADPWLAGFTASRTGRAWGETALSGKERAYLALTADVAHQTLGTSFRRHVELARDRGAADGEIRDLLRFTAEFGIAKAAAALHELDAILLAAGHDQDAEGA